MTTIPSAPVDLHTATLLDFIDEQLEDTADREAILRAIRRTADAEGRIDPNALRAELDGKVANHRAIGATIHGLTDRGVIEWRGEWVVTTGSKTGNNGKPARVYHLRAEHAA